MNYRFERGQCPAKAQLGCHGLGKFMSRLSKVEHDSESTVMTTDLEPVEFYNILPTYFESFRTGIF